MKLKGGEGDGGSGGGGHHSQHHRHSHSIGSDGNNFPTTGLTAPTVSTSANPGFSFREVLEVSPSLRGIAMTGPTNKFVDSVGTLHIVGELKNEATRTLTENQIVATIYGLRNQTLGLDYATPTPDSLSPG